MCNRWVESGTGPNDGNRTGNWSVRLDSPTLSSIEQNASSVYCRKRWSFQEEQRTLPRPDYAKVVVRSATQLEVTVRLHLVQGKKFQGPLSPRRSHLLGPATYISATPSCRTLPNRYFRTGQRLRSWKRIFLSLDVYADYCSFSGEKQTTPGLFPDFEKNRMFQVFGTEMVD